MQTSLKREAHISIPYQEEHSDKKHIERKGRKSFVSFRANSAECPFVSPHDHGVQSDMARLTLNQNPKLKAKSCTSLDCMFFFTLCVSRAPVKFQTADTLLARYQAIICIYQQVIIRP